MTGVGYLFHGKLKEFSNSVNNFLSKFVGIFNIRLSNVKTTA